MNIRRIAAGVLISIASVAFVGWAWATYHQVQNHRAVRETCEHLAGISIDEALARLQQLGQNTVRSEEGAIVVRVMGPAVCRCKIYAENGRVQKTYAICQH